MKQKVKNNNLLICAVIIALLVCAVFSLTSVLGNTASAEETVIEVGSGVLGDPQVMKNVVSVNGKTYYMIENAEHLVYALTYTGDAVDFLLMHDFEITDPEWVNRNENTTIKSNFYGFVIDSKNNIVSGKTRTLSFSAERPQSNGETLYHQSKFGGLFSTFSGTLSNLTYRFSGRIEIKGDSYKDSNLVISCGGLAAVFTGKIENCNIVNSGSMYIYAQRKNTEVYVGGIAGQYLGGQIINSNISIGGNIAAYNKLMLTEADEDLDARNVKLFAGGLSAHTENSGNTVNDLSSVSSSSIVISANISTNDLCAVSLGDELGSLAFDWISGFLDFSSKCNTNEYIFPSGGLFARAMDITLQDNSLTVNGMISARGHYLSSKDGAITGGIIGNVTDGGSLEINRNTISLSGMMKTTNFSKETMNKRNIQGVVYQGGLIGKADGKINGSFHNCVFEKGTNFYTSTATSGTEQGAAIDRHGYIAGAVGSTFETFNAGNNWIKGGVSGLQFVGDNGKYGLIHDIKVYGGGWIGHSINSSGEIVFKANEQFAPFHGWFTSDANLANNTPYTDTIETRKDIVYDSGSNTEHIQNSYIPSVNKSTKTSIICVFLTKEIYTSGNMVEFAYEMNSGLNFPWIDIKMVNDITFSSGMPVINQFKGTFDGNGHSITFESGSSIVGRGNVGMFGEITNGASFANTDIVFAGTIYAGNQDTTALDANTVSAVLCAINNGYIHNVTLDITSAGTIKSFGKDNTVGGLIGINKSKIDGIALEQIDFNLDGRINAVGLNNTVGGLIGSSESDGFYEMINVSLSGDVVSSIALSDASAVGSAYLGGFAGKITKNLYTKNTVINVRDRSNYNNSVLTASCNHNQSTFLNLQRELRDLYETDLSGGSLIIDDILQAYFEEGGLSVAKRSRDDFNTVKEKLSDLSNNFDSYTDSERKAKLLSIINTVDTFNCSATCTDCSLRLSIYAIVGNSSGYGVGYNNTWVMGSYTQIPGEQSGDVSTEPLPYYEGDTEHANALSKGLNTLYVRGGSAMCIMDISSNSADNIVFTVSVDTTKVFTGWYTEFDHSVMVEKTMIISGEGIVQGLRPGTQSGYTVYSSVIDSLIVDQDSLNKLAVTTNAGQRYEGVHFSLGSNITVSSYEVIGNSEENYFDGILDGKGYTVTVESFAPDQALLGLFGCLGQNAVIKQLGVEYIGAVNVDGGIFGGISAINNGTIGTDSSSNKINATYSSTVSGVRVAGGLVGINSGVIKNAEVYFVETAVGQRGNLTAQGTGNDIDSNSAIVGGAVGYNKDGFNTLVKNIYVSTECSFGRNIANITAISSDASYAGGIVGYNASKVYSAVLKVAYETMTNTIVSDCGDGDNALLIGHNEYALTDGLWVLYAFDSTVDGYAYQTPAQSESGDYIFPLINGEQSNDGNRLIKYGYGDVKVTIYANNEAQPYGGSIVFEAVEMIPDGKAQVVPFYNYTVSMTKDGIVDSSNGGSGQNFAPTISTDSRESLRGVDYYAIFVKTEITTENDLYDMLESVNNDFKAYANYIVKLSAQSELILYTSDPRYSSLKSSKEFVGSFNGNGYTIRVRTDSSSPSSSKIGNALFSIISEYSSVGNFTYSIESGVEFRGEQEFNGNKAIGSLSNINMGLIENITFNSTASVIGSDVSFVGGLVGYNSGEVSGIIASFNYDNSQGLEYGGSVLGYVSGGIVGYNNGSVGSERLDSIKLVINSGNVMSSVIGAYRSGGIIGINNGNAKNLNIRIYGRVSSPDISGNSYNIKGTSYELLDTAVGGVVGENLSNLYSAVCYIYQGAELHTENQGSLGLMVGVNTGIIGGEEDAIRSYSYAEISSNGFAFGGIVGSLTSGMVNKSEASIYGSVSGFKYSGGAVGYNNEGTLSETSVYINSGVTFDALTAVGGLVGKNEGTTTFCDITVQGVLGSNSTVYTGGIFGQNNSTLVSDSFVIIRNKLYSKQSGFRGLVSGYSIDLSDNGSVNVWGIASNSNTLTQNGNGNVGFNTLKIVGKANVNAEFVSGNRIKFTAAYIADSPTTWYSNISTHESFNADSNVYIAEDGLKDVSYHVCYYDLIINSSEEFLDFYQNINDNDLFHGVMVKLSVSDDIVISGAINPIGTLEHPFAGIFEGDYTKIILQRGAISGSDYSGIFGCLSKDAIVRNLIIEVGEDFLVGSGTSNYTGVLAGRIDGKVSNVTVNAFSVPYSLVTDAYGGVLAGLVSDSAVLTDVWTVIYNDSAQPIGVREGVTIEEKDNIVNKLSVIGLGKLCVSFTEYGKSNITFSVLSSENDDVFAYFDDLYYDISSRTTLSSLNRSDIFGSIDSRPEDGVVIYSALGGIREKAKIDDIDFTLSFIDLVIRSAEDFYEFAENVNTFGDNGAMFTLDLGKDAGNNYITELVIDMGRLTPIGTVEHPFTGVFDGLIDTNANAANACYTIRLVGDLNSDYNAYSGLFGNVGKGGKIKNIIVRADNATENPSYDGQTFGDKKSIYTGYLVAFLSGSIENVTVVLGEQTELYNINTDSVGGLVGVFDSNASFNNAWLVLPENSDYRIAGGYKDDLGTIYTELSVSGINMPDILYICGEGLLNITFTRTDTTKPIDDLNTSIVFSLTAIANGEPVFGFIREDGSTVDRMTTLVSPSSSPLVGESFLAVFLNPTIRTYDDLVKLSALTNSGRAYRGIEFSQVADITIPTDADYMPIGGEVILDSSALGEYKLIEFIGKYNGNGHKIIIPEGACIDKAYSGIFGILGKGASVSNLYIELLGTVGGAETKYSGTLSAIDNGAKLKNIIVELGKSSSINGTLSTSRVAVNQAVKTDAYGNVINWNEIEFAQNVWVLCYNNRFNNEGNNKEQAFYDSAVSSGEFKQNGVYNGGINVITVVGAGELKISFSKQNDTINGVNIQRVGGHIWKEWYSFVDGNKEAFTEISEDVSDITFDISRTGLILYSSFLKSEISTDEDLKALAEDTNSGYDFYGLTFTLVNDVVIDDPDYVGIGAVIPFNATFDGQGNRITLANGIIIKGKYAGIFGHIGEYGKLKNVIIEINGELGWSKYTEEQIASGAVNTQYAGAIAYLDGVVENVIIIGTDAQIDCIESEDGNSYGAIAFGYDSRNLLTNTWIITKANNINRDIGFVANIGESSINRMKVIGMGALSVSFEITDGEYIVKMENSALDRYSVKGWYSNYSLDNQLSKALGVTANDTDVTAGDHGVYYPKTSLINRRYEVVIIDTVITEAEQLLSISLDVNKGGYTYANTDFTLGADIVITDQAFEAIGTATTSFEGTLSGYYNGSYYSITIDMTKRYADGSYVSASVPLFGYNEGIIENLSVILKNDIRMSNGDVGVVAVYNKGTISGVSVSFNENAQVTVKGNVVGAISAYNYENARIENSIVIINEQTSLVGLTVGGIVGVNNGYVLGSSGGDNSQFTVWSELRSGVLCGLNEITSVSLLGKIEVLDGGENASGYGGGAIGISQDRGYVASLTVRTYLGSQIISDAKGQAVGGIVGRSSATLIDSVCIAKGTVSGVVGSDIGYFVGSIQGSANNSWLVIDIPTTATAIGNGYQAVNVLEVSGNGIIDAYIDSDGNVIFINITEKYGSEQGQVAEIDGWYEGNGIAVTDSIGNVDENTFKPLNNITGRTVSVVFINLIISSVDDINVMAQTVNNGLFAKTLVFTLTNDLTISSTSPLIDTIGKYTDNGLYGFKHIFDGQGHTITFTDNGAIKDQAYMGLFGYASSSAVIKNLNVIYDNGRLGDGNATAFGGIVALNSGKIYDCTVQINKTATLKADKVGGLVGENTRSGEITDCEIAVLGTLSATQDSQNNATVNAYAGGVIGTNQGIVKRLFVTVNGNIEAGNANGSGASYAGGISGTNSYYISNIELYISGAVIASNGSVTAYSGGLSGSNMGTVASSYVKVSDNSIISALSGIEQISGGLIGTNGTTVIDTLIDISSDTLVSDSAIGRNKVATCLISNVWVYNGDNRLNSKIDAVNCMTYQNTAKGISVTYGDIDGIVNNGQIVFEAIFNIDSGITLFADADNEYRSVLLFDSGYLTYTDNKLVLSPTGLVSGKHLLATVRREFGDGSELKALSSALYYGYQPIDGEFSLKSDITISGEFTAIGTSIHEFTAQFNGNYYNITFTDSTRYDSELHSLFGYSSGSIKNLAVTYQYSLSGDDSAGICVHNSGYISNSVVYTEQDVTLSNVIASGSSYNDNVWVISRVSSDGSMLNGSDAQGNKYSSIVINGNGNLVIDRNANVLTFIPMPIDEGTLFVGFAGENSDGNITILSDRPFATNDTLYLGKSSFTAEFISDRIAKRGDLLALVGVLELGYSSFSVGKTYTLTNDLSVSADEILSLNSFAGTILGNGHSLKLSGTTAVEGNKGYVLKGLGSTSSALFRDLVIDLTAWQSLDIEMYLLEDSYQGTLQNVSVIFASSKMRLSPTDTVKWTANNVYVVVDKNVATNYFNINAGIGLIIADCKTFPEIKEIDGKYTATAIIDSDSEVFTGWNIGSLDDLKLEFVGNTLKTIELNGVNAYSISVISNQIASTDDIKMLANAVNKGFEMSEIEFKLVDDIVNVPVGVVIGNDVYSFKGKIDGQAYTISASGALFKRFGGEIANIVVDIDKAAYLFDGVIDGATSTNMTVKTHADNAMLTSNGDMTIHNAWIIAPSVAVDNVNALLLPSDIWISSYIDTLSGEIRLTVGSNDSDRFLLWSDIDGAVVLNEKYNVISSNGDGIKRYSVSAINDISTVEQFKAYAIAVSVGHYSGNATLFADITLDGTFDGVEGLIGTFYGNGKTIKVQSDTDITLFTSLVGTVSDLKVVYQGSGNISIAENGALINSVIELSGNGNAIMSGKLNNAWVVKSTDAVDYDSFALSEQGVLSNVFGYTLGEVVTTIDAVAHTVTFGFAHNDELALLGYVYDKGINYDLTFTNGTLGEGEPLECLTVLAFNVNRMIDSEESWNALVNASLEVSSDLSGVEIVIVNDLYLTSADSLNGLHGFNGTVNGNYNSLVINVSGVGSSEYDGVVSTNTNGKVVDLAVEVFTSVSSVLNCNVENCWVISYVGDITTNAGLVKVVNKDGKDSRITVNSSNGHFVFDTNDQDEYKLYHWFDGNNYVNGDIDANNEHILTLVDGMFSKNGTVVTNVVAEYQYSYTVYVDVYDPISGQLLEGVRPDVPMGGAYFPVETSELEIKAGLTDGYIFWGFSYEDENGAILYDISTDLRTLTIPDMGKLDGSIRIKAYYSLVSVAFANITYGDKTAAEIDEYLSISSEQLDMLDQLNAHLPTELKVYRTIKSDASTLPLVTDKSIGKALPKHAGTYEIAFSIHNEDNSLLIGESSFTFTIIPRPLVFTSLTTKDKSYDTTADAKIDTKTLFGFIDEDNSEYKISTLDFSNIKLVYIDPVSGQMVANAGNGYYVMITEDSYLDTNSYEYFFNVDYSIPKGEILYRYTVENGEAIKLDPYTFGIEKAKLTIDIPTITIEYLDQLRCNDGYFDINELFAKYYKVEGLKDGDDDILSRAMLLLVDGDEIVEENGELRYIYHIKHSGSYAITPVRGALTNYNIDSVTSTARLRIVPSKVTADIADTKVEYGNAVKELDYTIKAENGEPFVITENDYNAFAQWFDIGISYEKFVSEYLSLDIKYEYAYTNNCLESVSLFPDGTVYGIRYRFASNIDFEYLSTGEEDFEYNTANRKEYLLNADSKLTVEQIRIVIEYTGTISKIFASADKGITGAVRTVGTKLVSGDSLTVARESGELVGTYAIGFKALDGKGNDITHYYDISFANGSGYTFEITKRTVTISHIGSDYYYGDSALMGDMKYSTNISSSVIATIASILGKDNVTSLEGLGVKLKVGYFGKEILNVGKYDCEYTVTASDELQNSLDFVLDSKRSAFYIIPRKLTVVTQNTSRAYDTTAEIKFASSANYYAVSGFVGNDSKYLEVTCVGYSGDVKAQAGSYLYRPYGCTLSVKKGHNDKKYLLDNYDIGNITDGKYTVTPVSVTLFTELGYYTEDGAFVSYNGILYYGDISATLHFALDGSLPEYLTAKYNEEITENSTDKEKSEWLISNLGITYKSLSSFANGDSIQSGSVDNLYLRSTNQNIQISSTVFISVYGVTYIVKDIRIDYVYATEKLKLYATIDVTDDYGDAIEHYVFNNVIDGLEVGAKHYMSENSAFEYTLNGEYLVNEKLTYNLSLKYNTVGSWYEPSFVSVYVQKNGVNSEIDSNTVLTDEVEVVYTKLDKLMVLAKEKPYIFVLGALGIIASIVVISVGANIIYRNKRITKAAWREIIFENYLEEENADSCTNTTDTTETLEPDDTNEDIDI